MNTRTTIPGNRWLPVLLLALLLGAQVAQAVHVHADHLLAQDCAECKLETGHAILADSLHAHTVVTPATIDRLVLPPAPVSLSYRLAARGPPPTSVE
jgi:hypothetical protein